MKAFGIIKAMKKKVENARRCCRHKKGANMATNPPSGDNHRNGAVRSRSQTFNPRTQQFVKRNAETGRFMDVKQNGTPFKGVRKEK
jgi:hypothetical protein